MTKTRQQAPALRLQDGLKPSAAPIDTYTAVRLPDPVMGVVADFSPLSAVLAEIHAKTIDEGNKAAEAEAVKDVANGGIRSPEQINKELLAAQGAGTIPEGSMPAYYRRFEEEDARRIVTESYAQAVLGRLSEATGIVDEQGHLKNPASLDKIRDEEWAKLTGKASLQGVYGSRAAADARLQVDAEIKDRAIKLQRDEAVATRRTGLANGWSKRLKDLSTQPEITPEHLASLEAEITAARESGVDNPRGLFVAALLERADMIAEYDPEGAKRLLHRIGAVKVAGVRLDEDVNEQGKLDDMSDKIDNQLERDEERSYRFEERRREATLRDGRSFIFAAFQDLKPGETLASVRRALPGRLAEKFGDTGMVPELTELADIHYREMGSRAEADPEAERHVLELIDSGSIQSDAEWSAATSGLPIEKRMALHKQWLDKMDSERFLQDPVYQTAVDNLRRSGLGAGLQGEQHTQFFVDLEREMGREWAAGALASEGKATGPADRAKLLEGLRVKAEEKIATRGKAAKADIAALDLDTRTSWDKLQDAEPRIDDALAAGVIDAERANQLRARNAAILDRRTDLLTGPEVRAAAAKLEDRLKQGIDPEDNEALASVDGAVQQFEADVGTALDEALGKGSIKVVAGRWQSTVNSVFNASLEAAGKGGSKARQAGAEGKSQEAEKLREAIAGDLSKADQWKESVEMPSRLKPDDPALFDQSLSKEFRDAIVQAVQRDNWFSPNLTRADVVQLGFEEARTIAADSNLNGEAQQRRIISALSMAGAVTVEDVLVGKMVVPPESLVVTNDGFSYPDGKGGSVRRPHVVAYASDKPMDEAQLDEQRAAVNRIRAEYEHFFGNIDTADRYGAGKSGMEVLAHIEQGLRPIVVETKNLPPYTTPLWKSTKDMENWMVNNEANGLRDQLFDALGLDKSSEEVLHKFIAAQNTAINRIKN